MPKVGGRRHLLMAPTVDTVRNGKVRIAVMNVEGRREKLPARESLGTWIPADEDMQILSLNGELERARVADWVSTLRKQDAEPLKNEDQLDIGEMEAADRDLVVALLRQFSEIVEKKEGCPPLSKTGVVHHINTGDAAPVMERRRRHAVAEHAIIDKEVDTMLKNGVIEEGSGAWGFPVVLVKKKDGSVRFCIDYRSLNAITVKDVYPLPRVDETLEALHGAQRFTSLDLHAGYWQLGVAEEDKPKTAFTTRRGLFQFCRMPFGLCNAPSTFQRLMNCVLRGLTWVCCLVYLDDVIIFTRGSVARHVVELAVVLERLAEAGLSLKATKCTFAATSMEYLGHDLTPEGIKPTSRLVKAVTDFPRPTNETEVRRFVALAGYYRRFMPEFSSRMAPLTKLLRKTSEWTWGDSQEEAFAWAKAWLSKRPVLIYPDYTLPFKLTTDASKTGLGAVLSQDHGSGDQPVAYASKVNSPRVAKYGISELECLAVVWAVRLFRPHLYGRKFTIVTDHAALKWLMTTKEPAGRLHRWALTLQEYDFDICYRPGKENRVADALSRGPAAESDATALETEADDDRVAGGATAMLGADGEPADADVPAAAVIRKLVGQDAEAMLSQDEAEMPMTPTSPSATEARVTMQMIAADVAKCRRCRGCPSATEDAAVDAELERAADEVVRAAVIRRVEAAETGVVQFTDADIKREQEKSVMVQTIKERGAYRGQKAVIDDHGLVKITVDGGETRIILPAVYWALAFKEAHDSIWAGHLRGPQTYERLQRTYWWPRMREAVFNWVSACQECGSRKARPQAVVPPLRSVRTGDVCDRWAVDVAGPLPVTQHGNRYVIAAVEYTTRYAVAAAVPEHTAKSIARFLMEKVILVYGPMREVMMDGAREFGSQMIAELLELLQTKQATPVPYRPKLLGLVERFHRTWKDMVSLYVDAEQDDWDDFLPCALYAYNGSVHATHGYQPNELMMGRKLRTPAELLRRSNLRRPHQTLDAYHEVLMHDLKTAQELAALALQKEQARQAMYYNQRSGRQKTVFKSKQLVWVYKPARGPGITKFGHRWRGPGQIVEAAGYDNYLVKMLESGHELVTHCSFLLPYYYPSNLLDQMARDIALDLREEAVAAADNDQMEGVDGSDQDGSLQLDGPDPGQDISVTGADERTIPAIGAAVSDAVANSPAEAHPAAAEPSTPAGPDADAVEPTNATAAEQTNVVTAAPKRRRGRPRKHPVAAATPAATDAATSTEQGRKRRRIAAEPISLGDAVAGRTRARIRSSPYPGDDDEDHDRRRDDSPSRVEAGNASEASDGARSRTAGNTEGNADATASSPADEDGTAAEAASWTATDRSHDIPSSRDQAATAAHRGVADTNRESRQPAAASTRNSRTPVRVDYDEAAAEGRQARAEDGPTDRGVESTPRSSPAERAPTNPAEREQASYIQRSERPGQPAIDAEQKDEEPRIYVFAGRGRRGVDSLVSTQPRLPRIAPDETVVERRRRMYRLRTGRYALEFQVECMGHRPDQGRRRLWINQRDYEQLWLDGWMRAGDAKADTNAPAEHDEQNDRDEQYRQLVAAEDTTAAARHAVSFAPAADRTARSAESAANRR